jgi:polar amino acid transport system substrate-binding protein
MFKPLQRALFAILLAGAVQPSAMAGQAPLVFAVSSGNSMPMLELSKNRPQRGILNDVALAIATQLDRQPRFAVLPRKRIEDALLRGNVDIYCYTSPQWLSIDVQWSAPLLHNYDVITTRVDTAVPATVATLKDKPLGTVLGFVYPDLEQQLGSAFVRDDGLTQ